ncbi:MAG: winged-helix domain-containing protein [Spirochaetes bacterium]|nr:winged-helix domain-containing protein [Spirochaetota bacterium]
MKLRIGLLTKDAEILESVQRELPDILPIRYKSVSIIKPDDIDILLIDFDAFLEDESFQFNLSRIRKKVHSLPVIIIIKSAQKEKIDFDWFFDDFILFPLRKGELVIRIEKSVGQTLDNEAGDSIRVKSIEINLKEYTVYYKGEKIDFTYKEFELLRYLLQNSGQVFSRKDLLNKIWGVEYIGGTRTVDVHIRRLRSKLGTDFNSLIETVRNVGYRCINLSNLEEANTREA